MSGRVWTMGPKALRALAEKFEEYAIATNDGAEALYIDRLLIEDALAEHAALLAVLSDCAQALSRLPDVDGAYRVTCLQQATRALAQAKGEQA